VNCKNTLIQLSDFLDGDLDPALAEELKKHLTACEDCRVVVDTTRKTIRLYCNTDPVPLPEDVEQRLQKALAERLKPRSE
jgi:anti-sigma factor RsiW